MGKEKAKEEVFICPVGRFFLHLEKSSRKKTAFYEHLDKSRIEFLKALRSLIDARIEDIESGEKKTSKKKRTKIEIE